MIKWLEKILVFNIYSLCLKYFKQFRIRYLRYKFKDNSDIHCSLVLDRNSDITFGSNRAFLRIEENVYFRKHCNIYMYKEGKLTIRKNIFFNNYCSISCLGEIEIGEGTIFGEGVKLYDHNHDYVFNTNGLNVMRDDFKIGKIKVGSNCWIGSNVIILNNVEIGDNVIVGANCLVYKSIPPNTIVKAQTALLFHDR